MKLIFPMMNFKKIIRNRNMNITECDNNGRFYNLPLVDYLLCMLPWSYVDVLYCQPFIRVCKIDYKIISTA